MRFLPAAFVLLLVSFSYSGTVPGPSDGPSHKLLVRVKLENAPLLSVTEKRQLINELREVGVEAEPDFSGWADDAAVRVSMLYQDKGYFFAKVAASVPAASQNIAGRELTISVEPGKQYRLGTIHWAHSSVFSERYLNSLIPAHRGDVYNRSKIAKGITNAQRTYDLLGYINFICFPSSVVDEESGTVSFNMDVDEGEKFTFAGATFSGLTASQNREAAVAVGQFLNQPYNDGLLREISRRLRKRLPSCANSSPQLMRDQRARAVYIFFDFEECADQWFESRINVAEH